MLKMRNKILYSIYIFLLNSCMYEQPNNKQREEIKITFMEWATPQKMAKEFGNAPYQHFYAIVEYENNANVPIFVPTDSAQILLNSMIQNYLVNKPGMGESYVAILPNSKRRFALYNFNLYSYKSDTITMVSMLSFYTKNLENINKDFGLKWDRCKFMVPKKRLGN